VNKSVWISILIRLVFGLIFLGYGLGKLANYSARVDGLITSFESTVLPIVLVSAFVYLLPIIEFVIGLSFLIGFRYRETLVATGILMAILTFGLAIKGEHDIVSRNLVYFFILLIGLWHSDENKFVLFDISQSRPQKTK